MDVCITDSLYYTAETNTIDQLYSDKNFKIKIIKSIYCLASLLYSLRRNTVILRLCYILCINVIPLASFPLLLKVMWNNKCNFRRENNCAG